MFSVKTKGVEEVKQPNWIKYSVKEVYVHAFLTFYDFY